MSTHFNYKQASVEEISMYFESVSRQTVASVRKNNKGKELEAKLEAAFEMMQQRKNQRILSR